MTIEASEKNKIFEYITKQDSNGMTQLVKDLNDVNKIVSIAWWLNYGQESISNITKSYFLIFHIQGILKIPDILPLYLHMF